MTNLAGFGLPADAMPDLLAMHQKNLGNGVSRLYSGHDSHGLAFRFFTFDKYNKVKSEAAGGVALYDPIPMREVFIDKKTRLHEKVTERMKEQYREEWTRYEAQMEAPGTPLTKWGEMPSNEIATLVKDGIFTVEQFALQNSDKVQARYPKRFFDHFTKAQQFVARKSGLVEVEKNAAAMVELQRQYAQMEARLIQMEGERNDLLSARPAAEKPARKKRGPNKKKPSKLVTVSGDRLVTDEDFR